MVKKVGRRSPDAVFGRIPPALRHEQPRDSARVGRTMPHLARSIKALAYTSKSSQNKSSSETDESNADAQTSLSFIDDQGQSVPYTFFANSHTK